MEERNDEGYTPLMEAAREGHEEMVALLLFRDADLNAITEETQETALTLACCGGCYEVAKFLLKAGADANLGAATTPLMEAAQEGHLELVRLLVSAGADLNKFTTTYSNNNTSVHAPGVHASQATNTTASCESALTLACENGHTAVAEELVRAGAHVDAADPDKGHTALMRAAKSGQLCTLRWLLAHCVHAIDVNRATLGNEHTALSLACASGHASVCEALLASGADPLHRLSDNRTCLLEASRGGHTRIVELLIDWNYGLSSGGGANQVNGAAILDEMSEEQQAQLIEQLANQNQLEDEEEDEEDLDEDEEDEDDEDDEDEEDQEEEDQEDECCHELDQQLQNEIRVCAVFIKVLQIKAFSELMRILLRKSTILTDIFEEKKFERSAK